MSDYLRPGQSMFDKPIFDPKVRNWELQPLRANWPEIPRGIKGHVTRELRTVLAPWL